MVTGQAGVGESVLCVCIENLGLSLLRQKGESVSLLHWRVQSGAVWSWGRREHCLLRDKLQERITIV